MREIKFRSWLKERKEFIYDFSMNSTLNSENERCILSQYTGRKTLKGVEIWEGDVTIDSNGTVTVIENDGFQWIERVIRLRDLQLRKEKFPLTRDSALRCEVIGNIYENPELLKEETE